MEQKTATELEKQYTLWTRLKRWDAKQNKFVQYATTVFGGVAAGALGVGALIAVGPLSLGAGVIAGGTVRYGLPWLSDIFWRSENNPFFNFHKDSAGVEKARKKLEKEWSVARESGVAYDEFRKKNRKIRKSYSNQLRFDTAIRATAVGVTTFGTIGVNHFRIGVLDAVSHQIDASGGMSGLGEKLVYGERIPQKIARFMTAALADLSFISEAQARPRGGTEMPSVERRYPPGVPVFEDGLTKENCQRTLTMLDRHLHWLRAVRMKYEGVMGSDMGWLDSTLTDIDYAIEKLEETRRFVDRVNKGREGYPLSRLRNSYGLNNFAELVNPAYRAAHQINSLPKYGHVWYSGAIHSISETFNIDFKYSGYDLIPQETARALYELYFAAKGLGLLYNGLTVTEGWKPKGGLTTEHIPGSNHNGGRAVDFGPTGDGRDGHSLDWSKMRDPEYVFRMLMIQRGNKYFDIRFEPGGLDPKGKIEAGVKSWFTWPEWLGGAGMSDRQAENFLARHFGNVSQTTNPHFHMNTLAPMGDVALSPERV